MRTSYVFSAAVPDVEPKRAKSECKVVLPDLGPLTKVRPARLQRKKKKKISNFNKLPNWDRKTYGV